MALEAIGISGNLPFHEVLKFSSKVGCCKYFVGFQPTIKSLLYILKFKKNSILFSYSLFSFNGKILPVQLGLKQMCFHSLIFWNCIQYSGVVQCFFFL